MCVTYWFISTRCSRQRREARLEKEIKTDRIWNRHIEQAGLATHISKGSSHVSGLK